MSIAEILYRFQQIAKRKIDRKSIGKSTPEINNWSFNQLLSPIDFTNLKLDKVLKEIKVFQHHYNVFDDPIKWHFDPYSDSYFTKEYSFDLSPRKHGNKCVKHTWEINRFQFIVSFAVQYRITNDDDYLFKIIEIVDSWINENKYLEGVNWYSGLECAVRGLNWWLCLSILDINSNKNIKLQRFLNDKWIPSIYQHLSFIDRYLSRHSSANNHLIGELSGLFVLASAFNFDKSEYWKSKAKIELEKEIENQHSNGVNKEQAAEYIQFITDFLTIPYLIGERNNDRFSSRYNEHLSEIYEFIYHLVLPNNNMLFYGDADDGYVFVIDDYHNNFKSLLAAGALIFDKPVFKNKVDNFGLKNHLLFGDDGKEVFERLETSVLSPVSTFYNETGHFFFKDTSIFAHFNAAKLGYLSTSVHGHSDCLSFNLMVNGNWFLVDPGTYSYHKEPEFREYFKSTSAHNTIEINQSSQAVSVAPMIWHDHYSPKIIASKKNGIESVIAEHNGYLRFGVIHQREVVFNKNEKKFTLKDTITKNSSQETELKLYFHLHPNINANKITDKWLLNSVDERISIKIDSQLEQSIIEGSRDPIIGWYSDEFYKKVPTSVIVSSVRINKSITLISEIELDV